MSDELTPFFKPRGVAVVGASHDPTKLGYGLARNLVQSNFQGVVHFVNPKGGSLLGRPIYPDLARVPEPLDLAILLIPAVFVPQALRDCGERGLKAVVIGSGGFRETGEEGARLEQECLRIAQPYGMRLLGPNCIGLLDTHLPMDATFLPPPGPLPGDVAFISHSGAICAAVIDWARGQGFGLSRLVSLGNQVDVNETDILAPVSADPFTSVLTLYLEGVSDGRRFIEEASRVAWRKPIIALKVGRYASGQRAVASHTGALAGQENAFNAAFRRAGVIRANTSEEMFDWARALAWCPPPQGRQVAILTNAGGPGVTASDALEVNGLRLADFSPATLQGLQERLPPAASLHNPVDMLASASPEQYAGCLQVLLDDPGVHSVMVILPPPPMYTAGAVAKAIIPIIHNASKPVIVALMGERLIQEAVEHFRAARVPEYRFPERAASALAVLVQRAEHLQRMSPENGGQTSPQSPAAAASNPRAADRQAQARLVLQRWQESGAVAGGWLPQDIITHLLELYDIPTPPVILAQTAAEAVAAARKIGLPVVLKVDSLDIPHKSDIGGVLLNLHSEAAVREGFERVKENVRRLAPAARWSGVTVQRMIPAGQEVIIGAVRDAQFGPLLMFGSGGIEVEGLKDVAFALAPVTDEEIDFLFESTWAGRKLFGYRSMPAADYQAARRVIRNLGLLVDELPELVEIEINPLRLATADRSLESGPAIESGAFAIDVRARLALS